MQKNLKDKTQINYDTDKYESNITLIEKHLDENRDGLTFNEIKSYIQSIRGISFDDYLYYAQVLEDMTRSGNIVLDKGQRFFLKTHKMGLWNTPFYEYHADKSINIEESEGKYAKSMRIETQEDDVALQEVSNIPNTDEEIADVIDEELDDVEGDEILEESEEESEYEDESSDFDEEYDEEYDEENDDYDDEY